MADHRQGQLGALRHWAKVLASWQTGVTVDDPHHAVRDHREQTLLLAALVGGLRRVLVGQGLVNEAEWDAAAEAEAAQLTAQLEERFPGFRADAHGVLMDKRAAELVAGWRA